MSVLTLQQGVSSYSGCIDTHIFQYREYNAGSNNLIYMGAGNGGSPSTDQKFTLIKFDLAGQGFTGTETVSSAILSLTFDSFDNGSNAKIHGIGALKLSFVEGTGTGKDGTVQAGATWSYRDYNTSAWNSSGALGTSDKYTDDSSATVSMTQAGGSVVTWDVTTSVQNFINSTWTNNGWVIHTTSGDTANGAQAFRSKEYTTTASRPLLTITYTSGAVASILISPQSLLRLLMS